MGVGDRNPMRASNPNSEVAGGGGADEALSECPVLGRSNWLHSSHGTFSNCPSIPHGCGRDGRTPLTQKFIFGVRVQMFCPISHRQSPNS
jgi:hypothetical protein